MSTPRQLVADQLIADHTVSKEYRVYPYPYFPSEVRKPVIAVWRTDMAPHPSPNKLTHAVLIQAYIGQTIGEAVEDAGDEVLDDIMFSLQRVPGIIFDTAERTVFGDKESGEFQGWLVKCHGDSSNVYKSQVLTEGP